MAEPKLSIKQMKESIREAGLPTADLLERADIDARYAEAVARLAEAEQLKTGEKLAKRARTEPAERDWRATLFVWRGEVEADPSIQVKHADCGAPTPSITWQGAWLGTDDEDVKDVEHRWEVRTPAVAAVGTTPFGRFVSLGIIDGSTETMTLARRYIADDDPRAAWASPAAVLDACLDDAQLEEEEELALADIPAKLPWKVDS